MWFDNLSANAWTPLALRHVDPALGVAFVALTAVVVANALHRWWRVPRPAGYMVMGALASPALLGLLQRTDLDPWKPLIDLAVAALLFELGSRLRPRWLVDNPWFAASCLLEGLLASVAVALALMGLGAPVESAWMAGAVAASTSPVISLAAVHELRPRGQVAERLLTMCAVNSLLAILAIKLWPVWPNLTPGEIRSEVWTLLAGALYVVSGSFLLGVAGAWVLAQACRVVHDDNGMSVVQIAMVVMCALLAAAWNLSPLMTLLVAGMVARQRMQHRLTVLPQLGSAGAALTVLLFISLGLLSSATGWERLWPWVLALIGARLVGKAIAVALLARPSGLGWRQAAALAVALQPMSPLAVLLVAPTFAISAQLPGADPDVLRALLIATTLMQLTGPVWAQWALARLADETAEPDSHGA